MRYKFILDNESLFPVKTMCRVLQVTTSGYYLWKKKPNSRRHDEDEKLSASIESIFKTSHETYGSPRITADLRSLGYQVNEKKVARLMQIMNLSAKKPKRFIKTTDSNHSYPVTGNIIQQDFYAVKPNEKWVSDITYIPVDEGWLYLCVVIDLFSRKVVGWSFSNSLESKIVIEATNMAIKSRNPPVGCIFHSDRGIQYASGIFRELLKKYGILQSMSRKGCCYDNAVAESFFHSLKCEYIHRRTFQTRQEAQQAVFRYIAGFYNRTRSHSSNGYLSPETFERSVVI